MMRALRLSALFRDGYGKLAHLFAAILLWQWFDSLEQYWWDETYAIVHGILIAGVIIEWLIPGPRWLRLPLHIAVMLYLNIRYSDFHWQPMPAAGDGMEAWRYWFTYVFGQLDPFIWISVPVLALFLFAGAFTRTRLQVTIFVGACMLSLAVLDSFTPIYLWDEIAWSIFVGLAWFVAEHYSRFQQKHPESWRHMLEYPLTFIVSVVFVLGLVMASGLFVPNIQPILKDPYTVWMESRGKAVPSFVGEKLDARMPVQRNQDTRSGYSREDGELGGGFEFDYSEVMTVTTTKRSYWRGESKNYYTGSGWEESSAENNEHAVSGLEIEEVLPSQLDNLKVETEEITQTVTMIREDWFPVLFGAATVRSIRSIDGEDGSVPYSLAWFSQSGELRWPRSDRTPYPDTYSLVSEVPVLDEEKLQKAGQVRNLNLLSEYTQLPRIPGRVEELALEITAEADNDYDRVKLLESYLKGNFPYTNTPDTSLRTSEDFVDAFLFEVKEGYCDYYSTALAVMTRSLGIPARWVKGYSPGSMPVEFYSGIPEYAQEYNPSGSGTYTVRNADAHSWVEVYFEGYGWVPFEPTAGFTYPYSLPADAPDTEEITQPEETEPVAPAETETEGGGIPLVWGLIGAALVLGCAAFFGRHKAAAMLYQFRVRSLSGNQLIVYEMERFLRYCRKHGLDRSDNETLRESFARWSRERSSLAGELGEILALFERAKYSAAESSREEAERAATRMRAARELVG
ncbi:hypothetical protein DNH61_21090 [Paenibacillus sambharensis]|uniref:Transglutaminase-like domain-containing protein n=1 Tax=Paenibacillus sambharensis TaxID=1803190 RepID=A0A2W1LHL4_9BACL|nr:transglutaminase domain-containing protein [Paenibacillus sambharensis]PZD93984.1 hypothetical protein DNH61_21090 [Paenibacillus sambharensis]